MIIQHGWGDYMNIELTELEYRRLLDLVYVGNWVLNSCRGNDRFADYDYMQAKLFAHAPAHGMKSLVDLRYGIPMPSQKYVDGGIHEAICDYEDAIFFEILAEEMACRDLNITGPFPVRTPRGTSASTSIYQNLKATASTIW